MEQHVVELEKQLKRATSEKEKLSALLDLAFHHVNEDFIDGWRFGQEALELSKVMIDDRSEAMAHEAIAGCLWKLTDYVDAIDHYEKALDINIANGDWYRVAKCYCGIGIIHGINEDFVHALDCFEQALKSAKQAGKLKLAATVTGNIGHVYMKTGKYEEALSCYKHTKSFHEENGFKQGAADMLSGMAGVAVLQGDYQRGLELARRALEAFKAIRHERGIAVGIMNVGEAQQRMGQLEESKKTLIKALNYSRSINLLMTESEVLKKLSQVCAELNQTEESAKYLDLYMASESEEKKEALRKRTEQSDRFRRAQQDMSK
jgi:tetratricopeptide (TPR) repeat protein